MSESPFFHGQRSEAEQSPTPTMCLNRTGIQISWNEGETTTIKIQHHPAKVVGKVHIIHLQPWCWQSHGAQSALDAELQIIFASRQGSRAA